MVKYEINELHKIAQMGKECCEHLLSFCNDDTLANIVSKQLEAYEDEMKNLEQIFYGLDDIGRFESIYFNTMMKINLFFKNQTHHLIKMLLEGNLMGLKSVTEFIQCPHNSNESKKFASELLQSINCNIEEIMHEFLYCKSTS